MEQRVKRINVQESRIFQDIVEYSTLPPKLVLKRCQYAAAELAVLWHRKKNIADYYESTDLYLFDLTQYQLLLEHHKFIHEMIEQIKKVDARRILEFGGGIGEFSIWCSENKLDITYYDVEGKTKQYAEWRFKKHKCQVNVVATSPLHEQWDIVNIMDVLEHVENPEEIIALLKKNATYIFCNPTEIKYNTLYPQHISKYNISKDFIHVHRYLWKNKNENNY